MTSCPLCGHIAGGMKAETTHLDELHWWLLHHERDIANPATWDDYGMLAEVFEAVTGRKAKT